MAAPVEEERDLVIIEAYVTELLLQVGMGSIALLPARSWLRLRACRRVPVCAIMIMRTPSGFEIMVVVVACARASI